jgi:hypothetical protein
LFYDPRVDSFANMTHREQIWRKSFEGAAADERKRWYVKGLSPGRKQNDHNSTQTEAERRRR